MNVTGTLIILLSAAMHAGWNVLGKRHVSAERGFTEALFWGALLLTPVAVVYAPLLPFIPRSVWLLAGIAGFFQALYFSALAAAYRHGDLSLAYPVVRALPVLLVTLIALLRGRGDAISTRAFVGIGVVAVASFFLPMQRSRRLQLSDYFNRMTVYAVLAAIGTAGYSVIDDHALRILRAPAVLGERASVPEISFLYLFIEAWTAVIWILAFFPFFPRPVPGVKRRAGNFLTPIFMGLMIGATYGLVLIAMAHARDVSYVVALRQASLPIGVVFGILFLKEEGGRVRLPATIVLTIGLVLITLG